MNFHKLHSLKFFVTFPILSVQHTAVFVALAGNQICQFFTKIAAAESNVPFSVLRTISRVQTNQIHEEIDGPWPWVISIDGLDQWFRIGNFVRAFVSKKYKETVQSFDVNSINLSFRLRSQSLTSIKGMLPPYQNSKYASKVLVQHYRELGSQGMIAIAFDSRITIILQNYLGKFAFVYVILKEQEANKVTQALSPGSKNAVEHAQVGPLIPRLKNQICAKLLPIFYETCSQ